MVKLKLEVGSKGQIVLLTYPKHELTVLGFSAGRSTLVRILCYLMNIISGGFWRRGIDACSRLNFSEKADFKQFLILFGKNRRLK